jgi:hypothetical protein
MPVLLDLWLDDQRLGQVLACDHRGDLEAAGIGRGYCSFSFTPSITIPFASARHLTICRSADGAALAMTNALQARLADEPDLGMTAQAIGPLRGSIDTVEPDRITG